MTALNEQAVRDKYWHIQPEQVVIDVGCAWGLYTLPALQQGATVYAVDPSNWILDLAKDKLERLTIINKAVAEEEAGYSQEFWETIETTKACYGMIGVYAPLNRDTEFTTLDKIVEEYNINRLDWIKIDVEGAELSVLKGGINALVKFHPSLLIEDHSLVYEFVKEMDSTRKIKELLLSLDYKIEDYHYDKEDPPRGYLICK